MPAIFKVFCLSIFSVMVALPLWSLANSGEEQGADLIQTQLDVLYLDDTDNRLSLTQIQNLPLGMFANSAERLHKPDNLDFSVWYRIALNDFVEEIQTPISILVDNPSLDQINFYLTENHRLIDTWKQGDMAHQDTELNYVVPHIKLYEGMRFGHIVYIHVKTNGASATPIVIESVDAAQQRSSAQLMLLGAFFGVAMIMIIYNFFMFRGTGDPSYINYIGYVFFGSFSISLFNGFSFYFLPFDIAMWMNQHLLVSHFCGLAFAIRFAIAFLRFETIKLWFVNLGRRLSELMLFFAFLALFVSEGTLTPLYFVSVGSIYLYAVVLMANVIRTKNLWIKYYLASWLPLFVGVGVGVAAFNGGVAYNFVTRNAAVFGVLAEICVMAVALMDRFRANEIDKEYKLNHDQVTGLPNEMALTAAIRKFANMRSQFTLVTFEVPQAREIIPALGVESADRFFKTLFDNIEQYTQGLSSVYQFEKNNKHEAFHIARLSDSSFAMIFVGELKHESLEYNLLTVQEAVSSLIEINGVSISVSCDAGVISYPYDSSEHENLLALSLQALRLAAKNEFHWARYDQQKSEDMRRRFAIAADLQKAIEENDLELYHQPQIDIPSGEVYGSELLLRWTHPEQGFIAPDYIVDVAEETGVIHQLTEWVIEQSLLQHDKLRKLGFEHSVSINISGKDLNDNGLVAHILTTTAHYNIEPESVIFEITESATAQDPALAKRILSELHEQGFKIAIDDFGTGYSSLDYLSQLPFHELKIDKCFMNIDVSERNRTIIEVTVSLAHRLGVKAVAEGIENRDVEQMLRRFGCPIGQGYLYSKPMPFIEYMRWLQQTNRMIKQG